MLRKTTEERIFAQADKILAMEENLKSLSWHRVKEIGHALQSGGLDDEARRQLGRELLSISNANISLAAKLDRDLEGTGNAPAISPDIARVKNNQGFAFGVEEAKRSIGAGEPDRDKLPDPGKTFFFSQGSSSFEALESDDGVETAAFAEQSETVEAKQEPAVAKREESPAKASSFVDDPFDDAEEDDDAWRDETAAIDYQLLEQLVETFEPMIDPYQVMNEAKDSAATDEAAAEPSANAGQTESASAAPESAPAPVPEPEPAPESEAASEPKPQPVRGYGFKPKVKHTSEQNRESAPEPAPESAPASAQKFEPKPNVEPAANPASETQAASDTAAFAPVTGPEFASMPATASVSSRAPEAESEPQPVQASEPEQTAKPVPASTIKPEAEAVSEPEPEPEPEPAPETVLEPAAKLASESGPQSAPESEPKSAPAHAAPDTDSVADRAKHAAETKQPAVKADDVTPSATSAQHVAEGEPSLVFDAPQLSAAQRAIENDKKKHEGKKHKHKGKHEGKHKDKKQSGKKA